MTSLDWTPKLEWCEVRTSTNKTCVSMGLDHMFKSYYNSRLNGQCNLKVFLFVCSVNNKENLQFDNEKDIHVTFQIYEGEWLQP